MTPFPGRHNSFYDAHAYSYCLSTIGLDMSTAYGRFMNEIAPGGHILDAGVWFWSRHKSIPM